MPTTDHAFLIILDGWGKGRVPEVDALRQANTPFIDSLYEAYPNTELITYGEEVGLPDGQMGNSEVGHLNIGAGRVVYQDFARINVAIRENTLKDNAVLREALRVAKSRGSQLHFLGLLSDGGVHSHIDHLKALIDIAEAAGIERSYVHAFLDGRDVDPKSGAGFLQDLQQYLASRKTKLASAVGRYYAMDRDNRWERIEQAYDLLVKGEGEGTDDLVKTVQAGYDNDVTDEFVLPLYQRGPDGRALATIEDGDVVIFYNFRTDRPREITRALSQEAFPAQAMAPLDLHYVTMTTYDERFTGLHVLYTKDNLEQTLGEVVAAAGLTQTRIAETEKYPHVTFFFNGGREEPFKGEHRILIPSPQDVATYDEKPEMSAREVTAAIINDIQTRQPNLIVLNFANTDMVGHTGVWEAALQAAEVVDDCLRRIVETALKHDYAGLIIADHGNSDMMINPDGSPNTAHTTNPVPCFYVANEVADATLQPGKLGDVAPTLLAMLGVARPARMTGEVLVSN